MNNWNRKPEIVDDPRPWFSLWSVIFYIFIAVIAFQFLGLLINQLLFGISQDDFLKMLENPENEVVAVKNSIMIVQACYHIGAFILVPVFYITLIERRGLSSLNSDPKIPFKIVLLTVLMVIFFMMFDALIIEWNKSIDLPGFFDAFEKWAQEKEKDAERLTKAITYFGSGIEFMIAFFIIAIIPAIGEELVFRGLIQNKLYAGTRNIHLAIWISALVFGIAHFQFFSILPRVLLGALFGYLYHWSGNIIVPMVAHLANNGITILAMYLFQLNMFEYDIDDTKSVPLASALFSLALTIILIIYFRKHYKERVLENG